MNPYENPEQYTSIVLGGVRSPGVVTLFGHDRREEWDIKKAKGQDGASCSLNGKPISKFKASFYLLKDYASGVDDFVLWDEFQRLIETTTNGPKPVALPVYHPDLARLGFTEVVKGNVGGMMHDGKGGATVDVEFLEYKPAKPKPPKTASSKPGTTGAGGQYGPPPPDPNAAAKAELAALLEQAQQP